MKILKFGGKSLANEKALNNALAIIQKAAGSGKIIVVLSARGNLTNELEGLLERAVNGKSYSDELKKTLEYQLKPAREIDITIESNKIRQLLDGVSLLGEYSLKIKDQLLSFGELLSCKTVVYLLKKEGYKARFVDTRELIKTDNLHGSARVLHDLSEKNVQQFFNNADWQTIEVVTGFIASNLKNQTTTLGRNGSNYTATLLANFLNAAEVQNWTSVSGVYTANPELVSDARIIRNLSFREANELANFGTNVLHAKTILPLVEKKIPIRILNSFNPDDPGTLINSEGDGRGIKAVSVIDKVALVSLEGRGLLGKIGIDGRIFSALSREGISVRIIAQASSERGIGFIDDLENAQKTKETLSTEFADELNVLDISNINVNKEVVVISVIGKNLNFLDKVYGALRRNSIQPYLITNTINGEHVSLVIRKQDQKKAVNVIHSYIFGSTRKMNILHFGKGNVGATLINQLIATQGRILERRNLKLNIFGVADTRKLLLENEGIGKGWKERLTEQGTEKWQVEDIFSFVEAQHLENVVIVDNTASTGLVGHYPAFIEKGFDIVASNKHANTREYPFYSLLRQLLKQYRKNFLYETNVGAGLPLIDTIKLLHVSGDKINRIRGVFSGSLSFIFNHYSEGKRDFADILQEAVDNGFTESDPREDLSGNDVGRKLLILARELDLANNFEEVKIESLIPPTLPKGLSAGQFLVCKETLNHFFEQRKQQLKEGEVLRYVGDLDVATESLKVSLEIVPKSSSLGGLKGSDSIFEIYTESYGSEPLIIRGAGAGAEVTARGIYSDLLRLAETVNN